MLDWLHGRRLAWSAGEQVSMWNCLHLLTMVLGWSFGAAQQHHMDFSLAQGPPQLKQQEHHDLLQPGSEATSSASHQLATQLPVPCPSHIQPPCCVLTCTPNCFLFVFPLCLWPLLLLSLYPSLSQESGLHLFIYHCSYSGFKRHPQLGDGREKEQRGVDATISAW